MKPNDSRSDKEDASRKEELKDLEGVTGRHDACVPPRDKVETDAEAFGVASRHGEIPENFETEEDSEDEESPVKQDPPGPSAVNAIKVRRPEEGQPATVRPGPPRSSLEGRAARERALKWTSAVVSVVSVVLWMVLWGRGLSWARVLISALILVPGIYMVCFFLLGSAFTWFGRPFIEERLLRPKGSNRSQRESPIGFH